jgi:hypothetical protein
MEQQRTEPVLTCGARCRKFSVALTGALHTAGIHRVAHAHFQVERERLRTALARIHVDCGSQCTQTGPQNRPKLFLIPKPSCNALITNK